MRSRRRENMNKKGRTVRSAFTHWYKGTDLMRVHQGQLDWDWTSTWSSQILWMWLARVLSEKPLQWHWDLFPLHILDFWDPVCLDAHLPWPGGRGEELELPTGQETLTALRDGEGGGERVGEWEGVGRRGGNGNFYKLINYYELKKRMIIIFQEKNSKILIKIILSF